MEVWSISASFSPRPLWASSLRVTNLLPRRSYFSRTVATLVTASPSRMGANQRPSALANGVAWAVMTVIPLFSATPTLFLGARENIWVGMANGGASEKWSGFVLREVEAWRTMESGVTSVTMGCARWPTSTAS